MATNASFRAVRRVLLRAIRLEPRKPGSALRTSTDKTTKNPRLIVTVQRDHSMLTFEANGTLGAPAIVEKLQVSINGPESEPVG